MFGVLEAGTERLNIRYVYPPSALSTLVSKLQLQLHNFRQHS